MIGASLRAGRSADSQVRPNHVSMHAERLSACVGRIARPCTDEPASSVRSNHRRFMLDLAQFTGRFVRQRGMHVAQQGRFDLHTANSAHWAPSRESAVHWLSRAGAWLASKWVN